jgi:hypothetical protein
MRRIFVYSVSIFFVLTALAKTAASFGRLGVLGVYDPLLPFFTIKQLLLIASLFEFGTALFICFYAKRESAQLSAIAWLSTVFLFYRIGRYWGGFIEPCHCLGRVPEAIGLNPDLADDIMAISIGFIFVMSYGFLVCSLVEQYRNRIGTISRTVEDSKNVGCQ